MKQVFKIEGMTCAACVSHVEKAVKKLTGVQNVQVSLLTHSMTVVYDESKITPETIRNAVSKAGYQAKDVEHARASQSKADENTQENFEKHRVMISGIFLALLMYVSMGHMMHLPLASFFAQSENIMLSILTQLLLLFPILVCNFKILQNGWVRLWKCTPNMDSLIAIGVTASIGYSLYVSYQMAYVVGHSQIVQMQHFAHDFYFESAGMILTFVSLGKWLEGRSQKRTSLAIESLLQLTPPTAMVLKDGKEIEIPVEQVQLGDILIVKSGQSVPVDGVLLEGQGTLDESALTGESIPCEKQAGNPLYAGTVNQVGFFKMEATQVGQNTTLSKIVQLVEEASASKAPIAKLADRVSGIFVPAVLVIALCTFAGWMLVGQSVGFALSCAVSVLVISCPCALGLATPVAIMVGTGVGAKLGILFRSAEAIEHLSKVHQIALDKTGTVTKGKPVVCAVQPNKDVKEETLLQIAFSLEQMSEHPLAHAVVEYARQKDIQSWDATEFVGTTGRGISAKIGGKRCFAGNANYLIEQGLMNQPWKEISDAVAKQGQTPMFFVQETFYLGYIAVADPVQDTSAQAVQALQDLGCEVSLLTGDHHLVAQSIQKQLGIQQVYAELLPQDKASIVHDLQAKGTRVAMVGDGINDAPALACADIGIAMGSGTDIAMESADVILMKQDLLGVVNAWRLSHETMRKIRQNLFWAFFYNCMGIPLAAGLFLIPFGIRLDPMFGAMAMSLSSFSVVSNALRLWMFQPIQTKQKETKPMQKTITIQGMMCAHCANHVKQALEKMDGVTAVEVNHVSGKATLCCTQKVDNQTIQSAVAHAGYKVIQIDG